MDDFDPTANCCHENKNKQSIEIKMHKRRRRNSQASSVDSSEENVPPRPSQSLEIISAESGSDDIDKLAKRRSAQGLRNETEMEEAPSANEEKSRAEKFSVGWKRGKRSIPKDQKIPFEEFTRSVRALETACTSGEAPIIPEDRPKSTVGLVPFSIFERLSSLGDEKSVETRPTTIHLSFDEDNEEDMFAEAKDETETGAECFSSDCKIGESLSMFQGFSSSESEHSQKIAARYGRGEERKELESRERREEDFIGFSSEERTVALEIKKTWDIARNNYEGKIEIDASANEFEKNAYGKIGFESLPRIRELKNLDNPKGGDKKVSRHRMRETRSSLPAALIDDAETHRSPDPPSSIFKDVCSHVGFSTAGGRKIAISDSAIAKAQKIYKDIELAEQRNETKEKISSFTAAGRGESMISKDSSFDETKAQIFANSKKRISPRKINASENVTEGNVSTRSASATARGGQLKISKESSSKARAIFDEGQTETMPETGFREKKDEIIVDFTTAKGGFLQISEEASSMRKSQFEEMEFESNEMATPPNVPTSRETKIIASSGFKTAAGRELKISERALSQAKAQYREIENQLKEDSPYLPDSNAKEGHSRISEDTSSRRKSQFEEVKFESNEMATPPNVPTSRSTKIIASSGFKTAAGRELKISERSLSLAKAQYREIEKQLTEDSPQISDEASSRRKSQFDEMKFESNETATPPNVPTSRETKIIASSGFKTAAGRDLKISERALSQAKAQYREIENETAEDSNSGKSTGKIVHRFSQVSSSSLQAQKGMNRAIEPSTQSPCLPESLDFQDFTMDSSETTNKRKYDQVDDDTPMRREPPWKRKKGRSANDVQGRKLFDDDSPSISIVGESRQDPCERERTNEPMKQLISDEINASAAALIEDEEGFAETTKERQSIVKETESIPDDLSFDSQFSQEHHHARVVNDFITETIKMMEARLAMISKQDEIIRAKRRIKPQAADGSLYRLRNSERDSRFSWRELTGGEAPVARENPAAAVDSEVLKITARSAGSYSFSCAEFYGGKNVGVNAEGIKVGDDAFLILDERNRAGAREFEIAFLASPGVDPNLVPAGWVKNHYRWIVWKLASMDRVRFGHKCLPRMLTPNRLMLELKYRYDREIHRAQWPPLRRILEKNEDAAARLVLCVAGIRLEHDDKKTPTMGASRTPGAHVSSNCEVTLTDGWYSIAASVDAAFVNCVRCGKIKEGTKLVTFGAKVMNLDQGCSVLEIPESVALRIHTNSTRRARWDAKLDFCHPNRGPMPLSLKSVKSNGGAICKLVVAVARSYPVLYREKLPDGQFVFRNARCDEEAARAHEARCQAKMEEICARATRDFQLGGESSSVGQEEEIREKIASELRDCLPPPRDVTPVLKIRLAENDTSAMMTIWSIGRETDRLFDEGSSLVIYNSFASGQRCNELQINAGRNTIFSTETGRKTSYPERTCTRLADIGESNFNPPYGEFDTIGIVVSIGPAPHGMKNFEAVNLACPRSEDDKISDFLSILFWQGVSSWGFSKILTVGASVACINLEWRRNTSRSVPTAYCNERSIFTRNPRRKYLAKPLESLPEMIKDPFSYASECAITIKEEIAKKTLSRTPGNTSMYRGVANNSATNDSSPREFAGSPVNVDFTPKNNSRKASIMRRIEKLEAYGEPPKLPPMAINHSSPKVLSEFRSPVFTPVDK